MRCGISQNGPACESCGTPYRTSKTVLDRACGNNRELKSAKLDTGIIASRLRNRTALLYEALPASAKLIFRLFIRV